MPASGGTFAPQARFNVLRSYAMAFVLNVDAPVSQSDNVIGFYDPFNPVVNFRIVIDGRFWEWSSNNWTLDWIIEESYYFITPDPTHLAMSFVLAWRTFGARALPALVFQPFGINFTDYHTFMLPPAPPGWWSAPVL